MSSDKVLVQIPNQATDVPADSIRKTGQAGTREKERRSFYATGMIEEKAGRCATAPLCLSRTGRFHTRGISDLLEIHSREAAARGSSSGSVDFT
jgi:hypothetical protein